MSARTGLGPLELALLDAVELLAVRGEPVRCSDVLFAVEDRAGIGPRYAWPTLVDLGVPWRRHLRLVELYGNCGSALGDPPAEPVDVETRLSPVGELALAAERDEVGPLPLDLVDGSLYRGGRVPPFDPAAVVGALLAGSTDAGVPVLPTGGTVDGDLDGLLAGRLVRLSLGCTIRPEGGRLVITEVPLGAEGNLIPSAVVARSVQLERDGVVHVVPHRTDPVVAARDESTQRDGIRIVVDIGPGSDLLAALEWLRDVWPVTIHVDCRLPAPMAERMTGWDRGDGTGLRALADLLKS